VPLTRLTIKQTLNLEIAFETPAGLVPEYECREACVYLGYRWPEWEQLHWFERANAVAHYRTHALIEAHINDEMRIDSETRQRRARH
jgi:hypothetical protein